MKTIRWIWYFTKGLGILLIMIIDRLLMFPFVWIELPSTDYKKGIPTPTDKTPTDLKHEINKEVFEALNKFKKKYIKPATKRVLTALIILTLYLILT